MTNEQYIGQTVTTYTTHCEDCGGRVEATVTEDAYRCVREYHRCGHCGYDVLTGESEPEVLDAYEEMEVA